MIAFFVSAHGFGHASRASAVMAAIRQRDPACQLVVFSSIPEWFFKTCVSDPISHYTLKTDVGMAQKGPFKVDIPATLDALDQFLPFPQDEVASLANELKNKGCDAVVCDISPMGIAVAKKTGVPSILVENFTWDWIYAFYQDTHPSFKPFIKQFQMLFSEADIHIQTEPVCRKTRGALQLNPFSRLPRTDASVIRSKLGVKAVSPLALISTGGVATRHQFLHRLQTIPCITFVVSHDVPAISMHQNVIVLPYHSGFYHPDLVQAADLVIGKLGYSTLAEAGHAARPFGYIPREDSRESDVLEAYAREHMQGAALPETVFSSVEEIDTITELLDLKMNGPAFPNDAFQAADIILKAIAER